MHTSFETILIMDASRNLKGFDMNPPVPVGEEANPGIPYTHVEELWLVHTFSLKLSVLFLADPVAGDHTPAPT
jgi:hypothetical protein